MSSSGRQSASDVGQLYVTLITDLLSDAGTALPASTPKLITYQLAVAATSSLSQLAGTIATSPSLWGGRATYNPDLHARDIPFERARDVYLAVCKGILGRLNQIREEYGEGWRARRQLSLALEAFWEGVASSVIASQDGRPQKLNPGVGLILNTAVLAALQEIKARRDGIYVGGRQLLPRAEDHCLVAWLDVLDELKNSEYGQGRFGGWEDEWQRSKEGGSLGSAGDTRLLPCWLAAEVLPAVPVRRLRGLPAEPLLELLTAGIASAFDDGHLVDHLDEDLVASPSMPNPTAVLTLSWMKPSPSRDRLERLAALPISSQLGRLAKTHGRVIESLSTVDDLAAAAHQLRRIEGMARQVHRAWARTRWANSTDHAPDAEAVWNAFKNLLYTSTAIYASVATLLKEGTTALPQKSVLETAAPCLRTFGWLTFVVSKYGTDSTDLYKQGWWGLIDAVIRCGNPGEVEDIMRSLEPEGMGVLQPAPLLQSRTTYYFDVLEQVIGPLPDEYIESTVLPYLRPYLDVSTYRATFESAHSVVLAIFSHTKPVANEFAPFYTHLLLRSFPDLMTAAQLRLGFTAMTRCISASDDALAWWCILQLVDATAAIPTIPSTASSQSMDQNAPGRLRKPLSALADLDGKQQEAVQYAALSEDYDPNKDQLTRLDEVGGPTPLETQALQLRGGHFLLTLIDQVTVINLVLLRSLLEKIWDFILEGEHSAEGCSNTARRQGREALLKVLFGTLGDGLDMTKREEGIRWWLARRWELKDYSKQAHL